jgi:cyclophilin family peptidyl-prolyl cis-trans isomerase
MSSKRRQRARARQLRRSRQAASRNARRTKPKNSSTNLKARRRLVAIARVVIAIVIVLIVAVTFYYAVLKPNLARLSDDALGDEMLTDQVQTEETDMTPLRQWPEPPAMALKQGVDYAAILHTEKGDIHIDLFEEQTPITVNNFVFLARQGYYNNVTFHRVMHNFMAQTGDPTGTGSGGPGYSFRDEFVSSLRHDGAGVVSMANRGANTNGSQFFITYVPTPHLDGAHTVFGRVTEGMDVVRSLRERNPANPQAPAGDRILSIEILER